VIFIPILVTLSLGYHCRSVEDGFVPVMFTGAQAIGRGCTCVMIAPSSVYLRVHSMVIILVLLNVMVTGTNAVDHTCALLNPSRDVATSSSMVVGAVRFT
jgi:hypothetical protein